MDPSNLCNYFLLRCLRACASKRITSRDNKKLQRASPHKFKLINVSRRILKSHSEWMHFLPHRPSLCTRYMFSFIWFASINRLRNEKLIACISSSLVALELVTQSHKPRIAMSAPASILHCKVCDFAMHRQLLAVFPLCHDPQRASQSINMTKEEKSSLKKQ